MIKKTVTYTDYNGANHMEDLYFNLNRVELLKMESDTEKYPEGFAKTLEEISKTGNKAAMLNVFEDLLLRSYGKKTNDGLGFLKTKEVTESFHYSPAYEVIFMELATNEEEATRFVNGIIPANLQNPVMAPMA